MINKEIAYKKISELVHRFEDQYESYKHSVYNETQTRRDFIDPFFKALGWDVDNEEGYAEAYREVIHEDKIKIGDNVKAPDYSFRLSGGKRLFFVEAKKPSIAIKDDILPAYQVRRYGWSAKLPLSIITDFEEFAIYDCTKKPSPSDKASVARIKYINYKEYLAEFDFIWETFSKERVLRGSFDKYIKSDTNKKGTTTVDKEFLESLDTWRTALASNISKNNRHLDEDELNFAVQQTIDRLIFLRIAEDRQIEQYGDLKECTAGGDYYQNLLRKFQRADEKYNSGLFDFQKDKISKTITIENKTLKSIINDLYYPLSPYEFSVISVEILGHAYEQFLGKQISIDKAGRVRIEEKPEVRKSGGVYYTPEYIVDYIVQNTVGKMIEGKTPKEVSKIKIVDPACGSGSFLIGAYKHLLNWHKDYYSQSPAINKGKKDSPLTPDGNLTTEEKKRILLNNIHGVDIDVNAVEVSKLSLLLTCMEGETEASISQLGLFNERVLPTLDDNIKSGNSLIDTDYYDNQLDFGEEKKIKPFNWNRSFPEVFSQGGFDVVIGNPPYVRQELLGEQKKYFEAKYSVYHGVADLYTYFIEKGIELLQPYGLYGVIVANKWMRANYGEPLRKWLKSQSIYQIIDFGDLPVFGSATTYPCIFIAGKQNAHNSDIKVATMKTLAFQSLQEYVQELFSTTTMLTLQDDGWNLALDCEQKLMTKLQNIGSTLGSFVNGKIYYGIKTGLNEAFIIDKSTMQLLINEDPKSSEIIKPFLAGKDIKRYQPLYSERYIIFTRRGVEINNYPAIKKYLEGFKKRLVPKPKDFIGDKWEGRKPGSYKWYEIQDSVDYFMEFEKPKIMLPDIALQMQATFDIENYYCVNTAYIIPSEDKFLLGVLNSKLVHFYYSKICSSIRGGYLRYIRQYLETIPIVSDNELKPQIATLVDQILILHKEKQVTSLNSKLEQLQSHINHCEKRIDELIYKLYELTEDEIKIIEESIY